MMALKDKKNNHREIRVFVSSTFQDLHEERDFIIRRTFPRLQAYCRIKGIQFTGVDLRWGITPSQSEEGKTIKLCLDEIKRCEPYFINIIGQRYGWIPTQDDLAKDSSLSLDYGDLINASIGEGHSITEMEILEGVFNKKTPVKAFFFLGDESVYKDKNMALGIPEESQEAQDKLRQLRQKILNSPYPTYKDFTGPEQLCEIIFDVLKDAIDEEYPFEEALTPLEIEERKHQSFALTRKDYYLKRTAVHESIRDKVLRFDKPVLLVGESGNGKSAFMAHFLDEFGDQDEFRMLEHYVGADSSREIDILRHILLFFDAFNDLSSKDQNSFSILLSKTKEVLSKTEDKILIAIDAYNQISDSINGLSWLEDIADKHVTVLVTCTPGIMVNELKKDNWYMIKLQALEMHEIRTIIDAVLNHHGKSIEPIVLDGIMENKCHFNKFNFLEMALLEILYGKYAGQLGNALFLRVMLNELIQSSKYETLKDNIQDVLDAKNVQILIDKVLIRLENEFGVDLVTFLMTHLLASRRGFSEQELRLLASEQGFAYLNLIELLNNLSMHLMKRGDRYDFFHRHIQEAVKHRYASDSSNLEVARHNIVNVYQAMDLEDAHLEMIYQLYHLKQSQSLVDYLSRWEIFSQFYERNIYELSMYIRYLDELGYNVLDCLYVENLRGAEDEYKLAKFLFSVKKFEAVIEILKRLQLSEQELDLSLKSKVNWLLIASFHQRQDYDKAFALARNQVDDLQGNENEGLLSKSLINLAKCAISVADWSVARSALTQVSRIVDKGLVLRADELLIMVNLIQEKDRKIKKQFFEQLDALKQMKMEHYGRVSKEIGTTLMETAVLRETIGDTLKANALRLEALEIFQKLYGDMHTTVGDLHHLMNNTFEAFVHKLVLLGPAHHETLSELDTYKKSLSRKDNHHKFLVSFLDTIRKTKIIPAFSEVDQVYKLSWKLKSRNINALFTVLMGLTYTHLYLLLVLLFLPPTLFETAQNVFLILLLIIGGFSGFKHKNGIVFEMLAFCFGPLLLTQLTPANNFLVNVYNMFWLGKYSFLSMFFYGVYIADLPIELISPLIIGRESFLYVGLWRFGFFMVAFIVGKFIGLAYEIDQKLRSELLIEGDSND